jgi:hypothetical protein
MLINGFREQLASWLVRAPRIYDAHSSAGLGTHGVHRLELMRMQKTNRKKNVNAPN